MVGSRRSAVAVSEGGVAAPRVLELLPGFWSAPRILELLPGFWSKNRKFIRPVMKIPLKRVLLNRKLKKGLCYPFFTVFVQIFLEKKIANFFPSSLWRSYSFQARQ